MSTRKPRKSLDDALASEFVHGSQASPEDEAAPSASHSSTSHDTQKTLQNLLLSLLCLLTQAQTKASYLS